MGQHGVHIKNMDTTEVLIVGGGPGGLACATLLAQHGVRVVLVERKSVIGPKVCAGGITCNGLLPHIPVELIERTFSQQHVSTLRQSAVITGKGPMVATVNRHRLGQWMADQAQRAGVTLLTGTRLLSLEEHHAGLEHLNGQRHRLQFEQLVGADGTNSLVRRFIGLPVDAMGVGIHCEVSGWYPQMEWHLDPDMFGPGYGWYFPHQRQYSVGVYADSRWIPARNLRQQLLGWLQQRRVQPDASTLRAGLVNYDYRGVRFGSVWLVGDAAGLASGLTGEGIYSAFLSGQEVARMILAADYTPKRLQMLVRKHGLHRRLLASVMAKPRIGSLMMEVMIMLLRSKMIAFRHLEMAD